MPRDGKYAARTLLFPATRLALCSANSSSASVASPAGFQNAASPRPADAVAVCPIPTAWAPTGNTRNSAPALSGASCALSARGIINDASNPPLKRLRLIDQHDRDVIFDGVNQPAGMAGECFRVQTMLERPFAFRADEDFEEIRSETHEAYPSRLSAGSLRRHFGSTLTCRSRNTRPPSSASILARAAAP